MSRVYATTDKGERILAYLECDTCSAKIRPHPDIANSGWVRYGTYRGPGGDHDEGDACPECSDKVPGAPG